MDSIGSRDMVTRAHALPSRTCSGYPGSWIFLPRWAQVWFQKLHSFSQGQGRPTPDVHKGMPGWGWRQGSVVQEPFFAQYEMGGGEELRAELQRNRMGQASGIDLSLPMSRYTPLCNWEPQILNLTFQIIIKIYWSQKEARTYII